MSDVNIVANADDMCYIYEADSCGGCMSNGITKFKKAMEWLKTSGIVLNSSKTEAAHLS
jgi:hypothetical protein